MGHKTGTVLRNKQAESAPAVRAIRALLVAPRVLKMYPSGHQRVVAQAADLAAVFEQMIRAHDGACMFLVQEMKIAVNGEILADCVELTTGLALILRQRRIRSVTVRSGIEPAEIGVLVELLAHDQQQLLDEGGPDAFLVERECPHLVVEALSAVDGAGALPQNVTDALGQSYASQETFDRMSRLRETLETHDGEDETGGELAELFDRLLTDFFSDPMWQDMTADQIREAFHNFVGLLEHALRRGNGGEQVTARIASLKSLFADLAPQDLLGRVSEAAATFTGSVDYRVSEVQPSLAADLEATPHECLQDDFDTHLHTVNALLALADSMFAASTPAEHQIGRTAFLSALADDRFDDAAVAYVLDHASFDMPEPAHEDRDALLQAMVEAIAGEEALVLALSLRDTENPVLAAILDRLAASTQRFAQLVRVAKLPLSDEARRQVLATLASQVNARPRVFCSWARDALDVVLEPVVLGAILGRCRVAVDAICLDVFRKGTPRHRVALIRFLQSHGSSRALELLALGLAAVDATQESQFLAAIASFRNAEAVGVLRKLVDRFNQEGGRIKRITPVLRQLHRMEAVEAREFCWEILTRRARIFHHYRWKVRRVVQRLIDGKYVS